MKKYLSLFLFSFLFTIVANAHPGGHYTKEDLAGLHHWDVTSGKEAIVGNFMMAKGDAILIEGIDGKIWRVNTNQLSANDISYLDATIMDINQKNGINLSLITNTAATSGWTTTYIIQMALWALLAIGFYMLAYRAFKKNLNRSWQMAFSVLTICFSVFFFLSCKKTTPTPGGNGNNTDSNYIPKTTTSFIDSAFQPYKPLISTDWDTTYFYVSGGGFPNHNMMIGITSWQQQVPIPQAYNGTNHWSIPLQPVFSSTPLSTRTNLMKGAVAIAVNGIPIFNALNNRGEDSYAIGELDNWGGHCGKGDDYHYHAAPMHLSGTSGNLPIAFGLDGFAVYGAKEPDGTSMQPLDTCHGHRYNSGVYHYHGTTTYPYVIGAMRGKVTLDPATTAPENQILPQAFAHPIRPATSPLRNAVITDYTSPTTTSRNLTYMIGNRSGHVNYSWSNGHYYFTFIDTAGTTTNATY